MSIIPKLEKADGQSMDIVESNIEQLKELFPEVFTEGKISFDRLQEVLGNYVVTDEDHYNFTWHGKRAAGRLAQTPSTGTLRPCPKESVDWDKTQNLFIEGDNLEVLKLLQKSYHRQVKMIYIDPPYNTGNDFVYEDDFKDGVKNYLEVTGQLDSEGKKKGTNSSAAGRYHTNWLNMMYPRLKLARNLLRDDGVIFISISDEEQSNLKKLCDEIFGEENFEGHIHWRRRHNQPNDPTKMIGLVAEHVLAYAKNKPAFKASGVGKIELTGDFSNSDNDPRGDWASKPWKVGSDQSGSKYKIKLPNGDILEEEWMGDETNFQKLLADNRIVFPNGGKGAPRKKYFKFERESEGQCATNWWDCEQFGHNQEGNAVLTELMDGIKNTFSNPKPPRLLRNLMAIANCKKNDLVLDFFAGSGTIYHAALEYDLPLRVIAVQLPEALDEKNKDHAPAIEFCKKNGLKLSLAELTKQRMRRVASKTKSQANQTKISNSSPDLLSGESKVTEKQNVDLGFKVFKLDTSNIKTWEAGFDTLKDDLIAAADYIKQDRSSDDIVFELLLKYGLDLTVPIETRTIAGKKVYSIGLGALIVCLDNDVPMETVNGIGALKEELKPEIMRVVFKDSGFKDDVVKTNALQTLKRFGIEDIKSL
jgi:adenine-specific DNA-methyltransferase